MASQTIALHTKVKLGKNWTTSLPAFLPWMAESKVTLDGVSEISKAQEIDLSQCLALIHQLGSRYLRVTG